MENRINKPKVFLSHAATDKAFIERLAEDLRRCRIEPWLDTEEIRDGRPWLKVIFEDGIPTCDAVIVYFTENSLRSKMVEKELDATVVEQLSERSVNLLPYVSKEGLRDRLRVDIRTLHCREWNEDNYQVVLPTVVAEIWRSYLERTVDTAVLQEKSRRLEQELETKRLKEQYESSVFLPREEQEFQYLFKKLDRTIEVTFGLNLKKDGAKADVKLGKEEYRVSLLRLLLGIIHDGIVYYETHYLVSHLLRSLGQSVNVPNHQGVTRGYGGGIDKDLAQELRIELHTYGLISRTRIQRFDRWEVAFEIAEKMYRLKYWLDYNSLAPNDALECVTSLKSEEPIADAPSQPEEDQSTARALEADKRISLVRRRNAWREDGEGTTAAAQAIEGLFNDLTQRVSNSNERLTNIKLEITGADRASRNIACGDLSMSLTWSCPANNVRKFLFSVAIRANKSQPTTDSPSESPPREIFSSDFQVDVNNNLEMTWSRKERPHTDSYSTPKLADYCWDTLINYIQRSEEGTL